VGIGRFLHPDRLAERFNRWIGATAMADKAGPGDAKSGHDPSAIVGVLGEIERQYGQPAAYGEDEELPPLKFEPHAQRKPDGDGLATDPEAE
jgi:hypothetical protein